MNKVYKVIWSKVKHCYVVVSEFVKSHSKSPKSTVVNSNLERTVMLSLCNSAICIPIIDGFISPVAANVVKLVNNNNKLFTITVAAIVKNEVENVSKWVQSARSCADEIVVVDTGSTDGTVERFADYGIHCYHYDWNDDFSAAKNYMISLCHGDWIVLLDGDEWFREGCDVRKAIAKHHNNSITKAILADWICFDKDRDNVVMFSGGAVRVFRNQPDVRYFRKVHENLTIKPENFVFEPDLKMCHTGYSRNVNRSKHERNLRIMRTMFDFDNGKVEYPMDWRYIQDTYAGLGEYQKSLDASDKMIAYGVQDYSAPSWITRFNVLFAMNVPLEHMDKEFEYCFKTVPSVSGFRFLAAIYYFRNGKADKALDNYIEGLRMLMAPQDKVAQEHTYWRMYMPEASALASTVYLQNKQVEAALYACKVSEQYCGKDNWTDIALDNIRFMANTKFSSVSFSDKMFLVLCSSKKAVLATALVSTLSFSFMNSVSAGTVYSSSSSCASGSGAAIVGGHNHNATASGTGVFGGAHGTANATDAAVFGGSHGTASNLYSAVLGGSNNTSSGYYSVAIGGSIITASGNNSVAVGGAGIQAIAKCSVAIGGINSQAQGDGSMVIGGYCSIAVGGSDVVLGGYNGRAYGGYSVSIGGGITGDASNVNSATCSVAIGAGATTTRNCEVAIGSSIAPVKIGGNLTVTGTQTVTDGTTTTSWSDILNASGSQYNLPEATSSILGGVKIGSNITNSSGTISLTKDNVTAALGYTPPAIDTNTTYSNMGAATDSAAGTAGLVPAPAAGKQNAFLRGDGTWVVPTDTNTTYSAATSSTLGLVKIGSNITNSGGTISLTKDNVTAALGYTPPTTDTNTTYAAMSADELTIGTATSSRSITAKVLGDYVKGKTNDKISSLSINGNVITYTKGDGTTGTITTPNTTYSAGSGLTLSGTTLSVNTNGAATSGNTGVVSGGTLYNAIKDKVKYDGDDKTKISLGGTRGTVLSNLLGTTITADSTDAVTGSQLYAVKQDISGFAEDIGRHSENIRTLNSSVTSALSSVAASSLLVDTMDITKADVSLNNLSESGKQILKSYAATAVQEYMATQQGTNSTSSKPSMMYAGNPNTLTVTNAGNGSLHVGEGSYVNGTSSIAIGVGNQVNANNSGAFGDPSIINADESYVLGNDDTINTGAIGSFIVGNDSVSDAKGGLLFGSNTKASVGAENGIALGNNAEVSAKNAIALGADSVADIENVLSIGNHELKRKIINVADGDISQNSSEAVTGAQLFVMNEKVQQNTEALEQKADINASNIQVEDWGTKLGVGKVEDGNANLVTGGTVYQAIQDMNSNSLVQSDGDVLTIGKNNSASKIDVSTADGQNRIIRGVDTDAYDDSSVANVGYVNAISEGIVNATNKAFQRVDTKINKVGASAAALASLPTPTFDGDEKWAFSAGVGYYRGETAASAGAFYKPQDNVIVRVGGSFGNGDEMVGAGVSVSLNKGDTPVISKAQMVRTINAQAEKINIQDNEIQNLKAGRVADNQRIAELEAQLVWLTAKVVEMNK